MVHKFFDKKNLCSTLFDEFFDRIISSILNYWGRKPNKIFVDTVVNSIASLFKNG